MDQISPPIPKQIQKNSNSKKVKFNEKIGYINVKSQSKETLHKSTKHNPKLVAYHDHKNGVIAKQVCQNETDYFKKFDLGNIPIEFQDRCQSCKNCHCTKRYESI